MQTSPSVEPATRLDVVGAFINAALIAAADANAPNEVLDLLLDALRATEEAS